MFRTALSAILFLVISTGFCQSKDELLKGFEVPPNSAKPRVWWHWMNGNITKAGISKDLLWMHQSGIGGFQNFDASMSTPQIVDKRLVYMTPEWKAAFRHTARLADSLQLEMAIAGSPGWSESGGPWVKPEDGMKKIVWNQKLVKGGTKAIRIDAPARTTGPIQNVPKLAGFEAPDTHALPTYYKDIAVIAYKLPAAEIPLSELKPKVTSSSGTFDLNQLTDGDLAKTVLLPRDSVAGYAWIQFDFVKPTTIHALTIVGGGDRGPFGLYGEMKDTRGLQVSDDGKNFKEISFIPAGNVVQQTISFAPVTAKFFRVRFNNPPALPNFGAMFGAGGPPKPPAGTDVAELALHTGPRINWAEEKSAFAPAMDLASKKTENTSQVILANDVIDLTSSLQPDGSLNWTAPAGNWNIVRFGYSLTGINNHPASPEATGLEVDKLDAQAVKRYFTNYLDQYKVATDGYMGAKGLQFVVTDSWEAGAQNWTPEMANEFRKRRGYDITPWLPVISGRIVKSVEASEQFLADFRKTLSELVAENHYDQLTKILQSYGMKRYTESHEDRRAIIADGMDVKRTAAVPMSAMWTPNPFMNQNNLTKFEADIRESASVAHIYGQNLVAAESLTALGFPMSAWSFSPEILKPTADLELASGLNRFVIHTSVHQPVDDKLPGLSLGPFGQWFNRHETWANQARAWTEYLSRSSYMLQQGKFVADVLIYYGEDNNITSLYGNKLPDVPEGYAYDFINNDALLRLLSVKDGKFVTPSGMSYELLVLDENAKRVSLPVLKKLAEFVKAGGKISGVKVEATPSLSDDPATFNNLVDEIWGASKSNVLTGKSIAAALSTLALVPDFAYTRSAPATKLLYVHRTTPDGEIYWVNNRSNESLTTEATFRTVDRMPKIWHPETGKTEPVSYKIENGVTKVMLNLVPADAVFIVFTEKAATPVVTLSSSKTNVLSIIDGEWAVSFQPNRGAPASIRMNALTSWTENTDAGVKYFSGTASYEKAIEISKDAIKTNSPIILDLGEVKELAEVFVNGKSLGIIWKKPFTIDIRSALQAGPNQLEIQVTNLWVNRLIGDQQPGAQKITYTTMPFYQANSPLMKSGLLGPVRLLTTAPVSTTKPGK